MNNKNIFFFFLFRLSDGGFTVHYGDETDPALPQWLPWMFQLEPYEILPEMKYSGKIYKQYCVFFFFYFNQGTQQCTPSFCFR